MTPIQWCLLIAGVLFVLTIAFGLVGFLSSFDGPAWRAKVFVPLALICNAAMWLSLAAIVFILAGKVH